MRVILQQLAENILRELERPEYDLAAINETVIAMQTAIDHAIAREVRTQLTAMQQIETLVREKRFEL